MTQTNLKLSDIINNTIKTNITFLNISLIVIILFINVFFIHIPIKKYIIFILGIFLVFIVYQLVYDPSYVQYLLNLQYSESFRTFILHYGKVFSLKRFTPSKAMPIPKKDHFVFLGNFINNSFIGKEVYKYQRKLQTYLLLIARICIIILLLPQRKFVTFNFDTFHVKSMNWNRLQQEKRFFLGKKNNYLQTIVDLI